MRVKGKPNPTKFGAHLRAARLGFHWSEQHKRYLRMSPVGEHHEVEACTMAGLFGDKRADAHVRRGNGHWVWWEGDDVADLLRASPVLEELREHPDRFPADYLVWTLDDNGESVAMGAR